MTPSSGLGPALFAIGALSWVSVAVPAPASAEWRPSGALTAAVLLRDSYPGPAILVDLWEPLGPLLVGGAIGVAALTHPDADSTRSFMPLGVSLGVAIPMGRVFLAIRIRAGLWAGALNQGLFAGGWLAAAGCFEYALDDRVWVSAGLDAWYLMGRDSVLLYAPALGLSWQLDSDSG